MKLGQDMKKNIIKNLLYLDGYLVKNLTFDLILKICEKKL
jgi:hypothetical protein